MPNEEEDNSYFSPSLSFYWMWIQRKVQIPMPRPKKLAEARVSETSVPSGRSVHGHASGVRPISGDDNSPTGDSGTMKKRLTSAELDARLKFVVGCVMATVLMLTTIGVIYALVFVTQPIGAQAENDKMFFNVLASIATFITGTLAGLMISTGRNPEDKDGNGIPDDQE